MGTLANIREQNVRNRYMDLIMAVHDPLDPAQREKLEGLVPGLVESKMSVYRACKEQEEFIMSCAMRLDISGGEFQRIVRILGGAEAIKIHPLTEAIVKDESLDSPVGGFLGTLIQTFAGPQQRRGLFTFVTDPNSGEFGQQFAYGGQRESYLGGTRATRKRIARMLLQHFPRLVTGGWSTMKDDLESRERIKQASIKVVQMCEDICKELRPLGDVANKMLPAVDQKAQRIASSAFQSAYTRGATFA